VDLVATIGAKQGVSSPEEEMCRGGGRGTLRPMQAGSSPILLLNCEAENRR
jgi:hypothetical protein